MANWTGPKFDVVIMDICDPIEAGPGMLQTAMSIAPEPTHSAMLLYLLRSDRGGARCVANYHVHCP
jgi:hypothetical protein